MKLHQLDTGGRRCVRVGTYTLNVTGNDPEHRIMIASGWLDDPAFPVGEQCITLPASAVPELIAALQEAAA